MMFDEIPHDPFAGIGQLWKVEAVQFDRALNPCSSRTNAGHARHHPPFSINVDEIEIPPHGGVKKDG